MKLTLFFDHRFHRSPDGVIYSPASYNYDLLSRRYLSVFDEMTVVARVVDRPAEERGEKHAEGAGVAVLPLGDWQGPLQYLRNRRSVDRRVSEQLGLDTAVMMIAPGRIGQVAASQLNGTGRPFGVEVVGDPSDIFSPAASHHPLRRFLQSWAVRELRNQTGSASAVSYVSRLNLPDRYPASQDAFVTNYSSIELQADHFTDQVRLNDGPRREFRIVTIGTLSQMYKGIDVLIDALASLVADGIEATLTVLGDGRYRAELERRVAAAGLSNQVTFLGHVPAGEAVRAELDMADLFVLASRTEGLPRSMIEAMARGIPCIGSRVGGIPELLATEDMVEAGDSSALAAKIREVMNHPTRMRQMAARNLETAYSYRAEILQERRVALYSHVKAMTKQWLSGK
jgi:glycosyltransferase involved in cell wall biosynthesis